MNHDEIPGTIHVLHTYIIYMYITVFHATTKRYTTYIGKDEWVQGMHMRLRCVVYEGFQGLSMISYITKDTCTKHVLVK